ncbi:MAG: TIGR02679 domain-containing protein [Defluviitaleaceae bacterium]|nr:TIGR02679 domain-containing protein [Defluviitaleaceae bacterium]
MGDAESKLGLKKALHYFTNDKGFDRLLKSMFEIYSRHGRSFGAVRLARPSSEEETAISIFFKRDYYNQALIRIGLADFERQMQKMFEIDTQLVTLLEAYVGRSLHIKTDGRTGKNSDEFTSGLLSGLAPLYENTPAYDWITEIIAHMRRTYRFWVDMYQEKPATVMTMITSVAEALNNLPKNSDTLIRLIDFSQQYTGSPYVFNYSNAEYGQLFLRALAYHFGVGIPPNVEESLCLYLRAGLLAEGVLSHVTVYGLCVDEPYCHDISQAYVLTLENLCHISQVKAYSDSVFIVENPQVYAGVYERLRGKKCTLICPMCDGMSTFLYLLRLLKKSSTKFYYAGNMDYKGLITADKLYLELGKNFIPWRYSRDDYERIISQSESLLPDEKKGLAMHNETLASLLSHMRKVGKTASSMPLVDFLVDDIRRII